jgi:pimeloyl-ACP methyl ester carboxylesterase
MPYAKINGAKIYYEIDGKGDPLLLIHGVRGTLRNWEFVRPFIKKHFQTIMPDLRGHGRSTKLTDVSTVEFFKDDMIALLDHLKIKRCLVAGHSLGGFIAQQMALDAPKRLRALILIATAPIVDIEGAMAQIEIGKLAYGLEPKQAVEKLLEFEFFDPEKIRNTPGMLDALIFLAEESVRLANSHGSAQGAAAKFNIQDRVKEIQVPTLVICGAQDKTFPPRWAEFYKENLSNVTIKIIDQTSHSVHFEQPELLVEAIVQFTNSL